MRLRQIALVARDLGKVTADVEAVFGAPLVFRDPAVKVFGLENALFAFSDTFLEIVSPVTADASAGRFLERHGGDGGYMVIMQCPDARAARKQIEGAGVRVVWEIDIPAAVGYHFHPKDTGGILFSVDSVPSAADYLAPYCDWPYVGPDWLEPAKAGPQIALAGAEIGGADADALAQQWSRFLGTPLSGPDKREIVLDKGFLRFTAIDDSGLNPLRRIYVSAPDPAAVLERASAKGYEREGDAVRLGGCWFEIAAA